MSYNKRKEKKKKQITGFLLQTSFSFIFKNLHTSQMHFDILHYKRNKTNTLKFHRKL